jgi:hypothetical protein
MNQPTINVNRFFLASIFLTATMFSCIKAFSQEKLYIDSLAYTCDSNYAIGIRSKNITKAVALQGSIVWDTTVLQYTSISAGSSTLQLDNTNMNLSLVNKGLLTFLWYDNFLAGVASTDDSSLFVINFKRVGTGNNKTAVAFNSTPTKLEIDSVASNGNPVKDNNAIFTNGYVTTPYNYTFIGNGNWTVATNWQNGLMPPTILSGCAKITINPSGNCVLNTLQTVTGGAQCIVVTGKTLKLLTNLIIQ